jgi:hypothetical protein
VSLNQEYLSIPGTYVYIVQATARGGASDSQLSSMRIGPAEYDCSSGSVYPSQTSFLFDIPPPGDSYQQTIIPGGSYVNSKPAGCSSYFSLEMSNGQAVPNYYSINEGTGEIWYSSVGSQVYDQLVIVVHSSDSIMNRLSNFEETSVERHPIIVQNQCGSNSASIIIPDLPTLYQSANADARDLVLTEYFQSTNPACPIISMTLIEGTNQFDFDTFDFDQTQSYQFTVALFDYFTSIENIYQYTIRAVAEGGSSGQATGLMQVTPAQYDCSGSTILIDESSHHFDIPRPD